jgi:predicted DCC family thiol-disulfide oxidoreductase YuxK
MVVDEKNIVFFDGECGFCNESVRWIMKRDREKRFFFASLQSEHAKQYLADKIEYQSLNSLVLISNGEVYTHSDAVIKICSHLPYPYRFLAVLRYIPNRLRDAGYRFVARNRKRLMKHEGVCTILNANEKSRFL